MFNNKFIQEAVLFEMGSDFSPIKNKYSQPTSKKNTSIFLISDNINNDIDMIKNMPARNDYKNIIIPDKMNLKMGIKTVKYEITMKSYSRCISELNKLSCRLNLIKSPYPKSYSDNTYITMSDIIKDTTPILRSMNTSYIRDNIFDMFDVILNFFVPPSNKKIIIINASKFKLYKNISDDTFSSDIINALFTALILNKQSRIKKLNYTIIIRTDNSDVMFNLNKYNKLTDDFKLKSILNNIGNDSFVINDNVKASLDDIMSTDDVDDNVNIDNDELIGMDIDSEEDTELKNIQSSNKSINRTINSSINKIKSKYASNSSNVNLVETNDSDNGVYSAKTLSINTSLMKRINPDNNIVGNYKKIKNDLVSVDDNGDTNIDSVSKEIASVATASDENSVINTATSARELELRNHFSQIKLNNIDLNTLSAITTAPLMKPFRPLKITTTNPASMKGSSFADFSKAYEDQLLDKDIVSTFMNLANLPDGFIVDNINVTDISNVTSLMNNWCITLRKKSSDIKSNINIRVPRLINGRFYYNGMWYNIGKQDFPIPILKINKKLVMLTSNYNKISVMRYDTKSLVDISMLTKVIDKAIDANGVNKYVKVGSSINTNSRFVSTIEFDEYAKIWFSFINKDANCEIYFNRQHCVQLYSFVSIQPNEFCCGMLNKVPIVINTDTALTRQGSTLTDLILSTLTSDERKRYTSLKPGKLSMYAEIKIGIKIPLGVACAAWEGLTSVLEKSNCKYQYMALNDTADISKYLIIPFKDKKLAIENTINNQLIFNGFYRINTKAYSVADFENNIMTTNSVYVDIFNQLFFKQYSQLTTFITNYNFFVDTITKEVCAHYHIPNDLVSMLLYAAKLLSDNNFTSENNASLYRIRTSEIIPAIIHYQIAFAISKYNNHVGSKSRDNKFQMNPNELMNVLVSLETVAPISELNPVVELHSTETITKKGFKGVSNDRSYSLDKRTYDDSYVGKMALSSPNNGSIGISRQLVVDPKIESARGYTSADINDNYSDLQLASFSELLTPGTVTRDDAIRTAIATSQSAHVVATDAAEPVIVSNGVDEIVPSYLSDEFTVVAKEDGKVIEEKDGYLIVEYTKSKTKQAINIGNRYSFNTGSGFFVDNKLVSNFEVNDTFLKDDILAYHEKFFSKDSTGIVRMNVGPLAKIAFAGLYSTYEDAGLITEKMSKKLSTKLSMRQQIKLNATDDIESIVKVGDVVNYGDPLVTFGLGGTGDKSVDNFLRAFQSSEGDNTMADSAKRVIRAKHAGTIVDVRIYTLKSMDKLSSSLFDIIDAHFKENLKRRKILDKYDKSNNVYKMDTLFDLPTEPLTGPSIKGIHTDVLVEIKIEHGDDCSIGDKIAVYGASKQIISEVVPKGLEPYTENKPNEEVSLFVAGSSVLKRMIPSILIISSANKVMLGLKEKMNDIWNK